MYGYKREKKKIIEKIKTMIILILLLIILSLCYYMYKNIEIKSYPEMEYTSKKVMQTISEDEETNEITNTIEEVSKTVVGISKLKDTGSTIFLNNANKELALGSGIIITENGYILSNEHVTGGKYSNCYVTLYNGKEYNGNVIWADKEIDLSIVKINAKGMPYASLGDSNQIKVGETVYAIGNPIGFEFQRTVTSGIISAKERTIKIKEDDKISYMEDLIQTDATINEGNSGGPLIKKDGSIVGINTIKITSAEGIGFAMPINIVKPIIKKIDETGAFEEANLGIFAYDKQVIPYLDSNLKLESGIYIAQVAKDGVAYKENIKEGDIITKIDDIELNKMSELREYIYQKKPGEEVRLTLIRDNKVKTISLKLGKK